jgi:hypothetical protein
VPVFTDLSDNKIGTKIQVALEYIQIVLLHRSTVYVSWLCSNLSL